MELAQTTDYPNTGHVSLTVKSNTLSFRPVLRLFAPSWIANPVVKLNGREIKTRTENSFLCIAENLKAGDVIAYDFGLRSGWLPLDGRVSTAGWRKLHYGPLLLTSAPDASPALPETPVIHRQEDGTFSVEGLPTVFVPLHHLLNPQVKADPRYQAQVLFSLPPQGSAAGLRLK